MVYFDLFKWFSTMEWKENQVQLNMHTFPVFNPGEAYSAETELTGIL